jgi:molecular chaperone DnaK (HSP70)
MTTSQDIKTACKNYNERLSKDEKLKIDYDYEKFKDTFNKEMEKKAQGN